MNTNDVVNMTVMIAGRSYPLKVHAADEDVIREIVTELNDKIERFKNTYRNKDKQDLLAMALLTIGVDLHKKEKLFKGNLMHQELDEILSILDNSSTTET